MILWVVLGCAVVGGLGGGLVPAVLRRLPEPVKEPEDAGDEEQPPPEPRRPRKPIPDFTLWGLHSVERDKEPYRDIAAVPHLALACALASALIAGALGWKFIWHPILALVIPIVPVCVAITVVDWRTRYIPSRLVLPATAYALLVGVILWLSVDARPELVRALVGLVVVRSSFWILWFLHSAGMGFGDVRLGALVGFVLGFIGPAELFFGVWLGLVVFALPGTLVALVRWNYQLMRVGFPFGPFMLIGAGIGVFLGQPIVDAIYG